NWNEIKEIGYKSGTYENGVDIYPYNLGYGKLYSITLPGWTTLYLPDNTDNTLGYYLFDDNFNQVGFNITYYKNASAQPNTLYLWVCADIVYGEDGNPVYDETGGVTYADNQCLSLSTEADISTYFDKAKEITEDSYKETITDINSAMSNYAVAHNGYSRAPGLLYKLPGGYLYNIAINKNEDCSLDYPQLEYMGIELYEQNGGEYNNIFVSTSPEPMQTIANGIDVPEGSTLYVWISAALMDEADVDKLDHLLKIDRYDAPKIAEAVSATYGGEVLDNYVMYTDQWIQIEPMVAPEGAYVKYMSYMSSDPDVVTVYDGGHMCANKVGTSTITVTETYSGVSTTFEVEVKDMDSAPLLEDLESQAIELNDGADIDLSELAPVTYRQELPNLVYDEETGEWVEDGTTYTNMGKGYIFKYSLPIWANAHIEYLAPESSSENDFGHPEEFEGEQIYVNDHCSYIYEKLDAEGISEFVLTKEKCGTSDLNYGTETVTHYLVVDYVEVGGNICYSVTEKSDDTVYVSTFNAELKLYVDAYLEHNPDASIEYVEIPAMNNKYLGFIDSLDENAPTCIVNMEYDYISRINDSKYNDLAELGFDTESYKKSAYDYTVDWGTADDGSLKSVAPYICPGQFIYNVNIAQEVFGTSDPDEIQKLVETPEKFLETAADLKEHGYNVTTGASRFLEYPFADSASKKFIEDLIANSYDDGNVFFSDESQEKIEKNQVFGLFVVSWYTDFCMGSETGPL
ncbi:MAG: hypothetical protein J5962_04855, partial [Lachnospiraceae bacterium]|nr:hypothetical protein [Lachnospiraceae bacterium]